MSSVTASPDGSGTVEIAVDQYADWQLTVTVQNSDGTAKDLTGATAKFQVRDNPGDEIALLTLTSPSAGVTVDGAAGTIEVTQTGDQTGAYTWETGAFDLLLTYSGGTRERVLRGTIRVDQAVTRP